MQVTEEMCSQMAQFRFTFGSMQHKAISPKYYKWKLMDNPFDRGGLYLDQRGAQIAGSASITSRQIIVHGSVARSFEIGDTYTNPSFRRQGVFLRAVENCTSFAVARGAAFIYGTPNDASLPGYIGKAGYSVVPNLRILAFSKRASTRAYFERVHRLLRLKVASRLAASLLATVNLIRVKVRSRRITTEIVSEGYPLEDIPGTWGDRTSYAFFALRNWRFLKWRYFDNPEKYVVIAALIAGKAAGYIVTKAYRRGELNVGVLCDVVAENDDTRVALSLFRAAEESLLANGCDFIEGWCATRSVYCELFNRVGYKEVTSFPVIINQNSPKYQELMSGEGRWHFSIGDSDNI